MLNKNIIRKIEQDELKNKLAKTKMELMENIKNFKEKETIEEIFHGTEMIRERIQMCEYLEKEIRKLEKEINENKEKGGDNNDKHINEK